ncbi:uncharacterized protein [Miscanthus floridulus]|uniref:uncharacterized protein n=1 Tax=Miscanthus floridulus TaxID=154761 RepID=UPI003459DB3D
MAEAEKEREAILEEEKALADAEIEDAEPEHESEEEMAPPPPPVDVWSLRAGQVFSVNIAAATFRLRAVAVNNAAPLESIFVQQQQAPAKAWVIPALDNLTALSRVDLLLTLGIDARLPILFANLYKVEYLEACRDWTWELQTAATAREPSASASR